MDRIFRLLLVDDEPHVTGALSLQLEAGRIWMFI